MRLEAKSTSRFLNGSLTPTQRQRLTQFTIEQCVETHCHCLPGLDDGPETTDDALALCRALAEDGTTVAIATPHQLGRYDGLIVAADIRLAVSALNEAVLAEHLPIHVVPGADVRIDERIPRLLRADEIMTLGDTGRYLLLELPGQTCVSPIPLLEELKSEGVSVILTHPGRCEYISRDPDMVLPWLERGLLLQITAGSLIGQSGPLAQEACWRWLAMGAVSLVASDAHDCLKRGPRMSYAMAMISSRLGDETARRVCLENPLRVLEGRDIPRDFGPRRSISGTKVRSTSFPENHTPLSAFDRAIEGLLVILLTFMPLAFGAVESWSQQIVVMICWAMMVCLGLKAVFHSDFELVWSWAYVPLGLLLLIVTVQLVPLPSWALAAVSPNTVALKTRLLGNLLPTEETSGGVTISFYSLATARALRLALSVVAVFFVTVNVYRRTDQIKRLLAVVSVIGGGIALLALAQAITNTDRIFWLTSVGGPALGGPFVNRNNFCQFMNLSVWAALALLLVNLKENSTGTPLAVSTVRKHLKTMDARLVWWLLGTIVLGAATVFLSLSRGGMISLVVSVGSAVLVLAIKRRLNTWGWVVTTMAMGGLACVLYIGFDAVYDRMASLRDPQAYQGRWQLARDTVRASESFPVFGAGLGTHEFVYPMFDQSTISAKAVHAENEYAQIAEETGIVGLLLAATFGAAVCVSLVRSVRRHEPPIHIAAVGLGAGLLAVAVHSLVDFGQRLPANACLSAVFCGLLVGMAKAQAPNVPVSKRKTAPVLRKIVAAIALTGVSAVWSWALMGADAARRSERAWRDVQQLEKGMRQNGWAVTNGDYVELVLAAKKASMIEPANALYRHWLNVYRWRSISRVTDPETGDTVLGPRGLECARSIVSDLKEAMALCPTFGPSYSLAGQLGWAILGDAEGPDLIRKGYFLGPCDAEASFAAGLLDACQGKPYDSLPKFQRAVCLDERLLNAVVNVYVRKVNRPDLAVEIAQGSVWRLLRVAAMLDKDDERHHALAAQVREQVTGLLRAQCQQPDAPGEVLAQFAGICSSQGDHASAGKYYRRALATDCSNVPWRLRLARALAETGRTAEAIDQAHICLKLMPQMPAAKELISELNVRRVAVGQEEVRSLTCTE